MLLALLTVGIPPVHPVNAAPEKQLQRLKGIVGYQATEKARFTSIFGKLLLPDDAIAITELHSAALLALPDSSIVTLGENTRVQVGAFNQTSEGPGATIAVNEGALRFDIHRPTGATANYRFTTPTTQVAVRGTVGLLSFVGGNTIVACLTCAVDSLSVTVGSQTFTVLTGQLVSVSAAGAVVTGTVSSTVLGSFSSAGVSTSSASGTAAATSGVTSSSAGAAGAAGGATGGAAGSAAGGATGSAAAGAAGSAAAATGAAVAGAAAAGVAAAAASNSSAATPHATPSAAISISTTPRRAPR